jgi:DNA polymerase-3 subunit delta
LGQKSFTLVIQMSLEVVRQDIDKNQLPPVYLWYGEDRYTLIEALHLLKDYFQKEDPSGSGIEVFLGKDSPSQIVVASANTSSFFSRRLVVFDDIPYFKQDKGKVISNAEDTREELKYLDRNEGEDLLREYLQNPNPATCLVLISEKVNRGRKIFKTIAKVGKVLEFSYPKGQAQWLTWIQKEAKARGKILSPATASFLVEWAGHHTGVLSRELDKLIFYTGEKPEIGREDIRRVCIPLSETTIFNMLDAIAAGKTGEALLKLKEVLAQEYHLKVHTMIVRQVRFLLAGSLIRKRGETVREFMEVTGIRSSFEGNKIFRQASAFSPEKLAKALEDCLQTELALKSSGGNPHLLLEMMIIRLGQK